MDSLESVLLWDQVPGLDFVDCLVSINFDMGTTGSILGFVCPHVEANFSIEFLSLLAGETHNFKSSFFHSGVVLVCSAILHVETNLIKIKTRKNILTL